MGELSATTYSRKSLRRLLDPRIRGSLAGLKSGQTNAFKISATIYRQIGTKLGPQCHPPKRKSLLTRDSRIRP